uniref:Uncharacterized protein n=1 Tax=Xenopus tropicalis TaxID=8364 RepID=A0A1B8Y8P6_XENTR
MCLVPFGKILSHTTLQTYCSVEALQSSFPRGCLHMPSHRIVQDFCLCTSYCTYTEVHVTFSNYSLCPIMSAGCCRLTNVGAPNGRAARCVCMCSRVLHIMCIRPANGAMLIMSMRTPSDAMLIISCARRVYVPLKARNNRIACSLSAITVYTRV